MILRVVLSIILLFLSTGRGFSQVPFACWVTCSRQCEVFSAGEEVFGSFDICVHNCLSWKREHCIDLCSAQNLPSGQEYVELEDLPRGMRIVQGTLSFCFLYDQSVYISMAFFDPHLSRMWWITKGCKVSQYYSPVVEGENIASCYDVELPLEEGQLFWIVSFKPFSAINWSADQFIIYSLKLNLECSKEQPEACSTRRKCESIGGYWCFNGCQLSPCRYFSCISNCSEQCSGKPQCFAECEFNRIMRCGYFSCALSCYEMCGSNSECLNSCEYWQRHNCFYEANFVCNLPCMAICGLNMACIESCFSWSLNNCFISLSQSCLNFCSIYSAKAPLDIREHCLEVCNEFKMKKNKLNWIKGELLW